MANQPKKYKKFVASAATATLVASAIVPVASAATPSDIAGNDHEQNIKDLLELGYVSGKADGSFAPNEAVTRGQVVLMLGKWAEAQGIEVPADYLEKEYFTDYPSYLTDDNKKYYALVKAAGIFEGYADGSLKPGQNISRVQMAVVLNSAYEAVTGKSLVELAGDTSDVVVNDIDAVYADYQPAVLAMKKLGITAVSNYNPSGTVTRGQFASFLNATIKAEAPAGAEATAIKSVTATGASQLTVEFDGVVDTEAATFSVTRGATEITVSDVDFNEDNTAAILKVDETFGGATYTVTVNGVTEEALTATVATSREQVTSVEFLSDYLLLTGKEAVDTATNTEYKQAVITFAVYNQYGEDITENVNDSYFVDVDVSGIDVYDKSTAAGTGNVIKAPYVEDGKFVVWVDEDEDDDATGTVEMTYERNDYEFDVEHNVTLSDEAEPSQVEVVGLYSPTNSDLTVENLADSSKEFYILFDVKDQFGVKIDAEFANNIKSSTQDTLLTEIQKGIRVDVSNDDIFEVADEDTISVENVDGKYYFAIAVYNEEAEKDIVGGENTVTFRSKATGEETSEVITVDSANQPYSVEIDLPDEVIAADEDVYLPVSVYNGEGSLITNVKALNDALRNGKISVDSDGMAKYDDDSAGTYTFVKNGENVFLKFITTDDVPNDEAEEFDFSIEVEDGLENEVTIFVEPEAHPEKIRGLKDKALSYVLDGDYTEIAIDDLIIEDQYGRVYDDFSVNSNDYKEYSINVETSSTGILTASNAITTTTDSGKVKLTANGKGSQTVTFKLVAEDLKGTPIYDDLDVTFRSLAADDFDSFKVESDGVVYGNDDAITTTTDTAGITLYGLVGDLKVEIKDSSAYQVSSDSKYLTVTGNDVSVTSVWYDENDGASDTAEETVLVTINETGETVSHTLTISNKDAVTNVFELTDNDSVNGKLLTSAEISLSADTDGDDEFDFDEILNVLLSEGTFDIEDQYDIDATLNTTTNPGLVTFFESSYDNLKFTISDINSAEDKGILASNGSDNVSINLHTASQKGLSAGDTFNVTITIDGKSQTVKLHVAP